MKNPPSLILNEGQQLKPHIVHRIKSILSNLYPNASEKFDANWLNKHISKASPYPPFIYDNKYSLKYAGKQGTDNHHYTIEAHNEIDEKKLQQVIKKVYKDANALNYIWNQRNENKYKGFGFQSQAEVAIAIELGRRKILFFSNPTCLIFDKYGRQSQKRPDFLVIYKGQARILEVDGKDVHENAFEDYKRDRLFERHGLRTTRFTGDECITHPEAVIDEFLDLFRDGVTLDYEFEQILKNYHTIKTVEQ
ncbi:hypothetical protein PCC7424_0529 [Gloeothece citriformis PCC 7424]|uniref:DUF559 domain-containing protein n=1 Tax=Gloeothece citriformis (strain PCC 7424) TaxID=65393 RepID=B7KDH2_GLOC7|nr:DUF559 domain-containing protein [Gloeothece citriformis]ACK68992.1 hypothetical protein PCC7424_0529 [Gloeothece citriformis PCC 7424]